MRVVVRLLLWSLIMMVGYSSPVLAQSSLIDPSVLSQLSDEEKARLLGGISGGDAGSADQDRDLQNPEVVRPRLPGGSGSSIANDDLRDEESLGDYDRDVRDAYGSSRDPAPSYRSETSGSDRARRTQAVTDRMGSYAPSDDELRSFDEENAASSRASGKQRLRDSRPSAYGDDVSRARKPSLKIDSRLKPRPFGYELFAGVPSTFAPATDIPVPGDYVLGAGDEVQLRVWGSIDADLRLVIDRNGQVSVPKAGTFTLAGIKASDLNAVMRAQISRYFNNFQVAASLGQLRSLPVFVVGQARKPGAYNLSSLSTLRLAGLRPAAACAIFN